MKELTRAEEQVMQIIWDKEKALVKDILEEFPDPRPAYNTVSTIVRILEDKGMVDHRAYGRTHEYFPLVSKQDYRKKVFGKVFTNYFGNSYEKMVSFFVKENDLSVQELEEILEDLKKKQDD